MNRLKLLPILISTLVVAGVLSCAFTTPIQPYAESKSQFGEPTELIKHDQINDRDIYRVYHRAATGFVSIASIRKDAEERAEEFANRQGKTYLVLGEQISHPPYILGNFPRIELIFALIDKPILASESTKKASEATTTDDSKGVSDLYSELTKLDELRRKGLLTDAEYEAEKQKLLAKRK